MVAVQEQRQGVGVDATASPNSSSAPVPALVIEDPARLALFLDIDGTLIDMAPTPEEVSVPRELPDLLAGLRNGLDGALALVTGRPVASVDEMYAPERFIVSGVHGTQLRASPDGEMNSLVPRIPDQLVGAVQRIAGVSDAILVEHKFCGLAVHFRKAPAAGVALDGDLNRLLRDWPAYEVRGGRMVLEVVPRGFSKASALKTLLDSPTFAARTPVFIGDDHGDDPALSMARALGGLGLTVGGEHFDVAGADFPNSTAVRTWLRELLGRLDSLGLARI